MNMLSHAALAARHKTACIMSDVSSNFGACGQQQARNPRPGPAQPYKAKLSPLNRDKR